MSGKFTDSLLAPLPSSSDSSGNVITPSDYSTTTSSASPIGNLVSDDESSPSATFPKGTRTPPRIPTTPTGKLRSDDDGVPAWLNMEPATGDSLLIRASLNAQTAMAAYRLDPTPGNREALMEATKTLFKRSGELKRKALREEGFPWYGMRYYFLMWFGVWEWADVVWLGLIVYHVSEIWKNMLIIISWYQSQS